MNTSSPAPDSILQTAFGFWNSRVLLTAVSLDRFTILGQRQLTGAEIGKKLVVEALIDDARRENVFGLLMSLNMLIEFGDAFDYSAADFEKWCRQIGFRRFEVIHLAGPSSAAIAYK